MPNIMVLCPILGTAVPTGLTTEKIKFDSLSDITIPIYDPFRLDKSRQCSQHG